MRILVALLLSLTLTTATATAQSYAGRAKPPREYAYGGDPLQRFDFWAGRGRAAPVVLYIHGGAWSMGDKRTGLGEKAQHFTALGYAFASLNYRLVPQATVEQQAADIAQAIAYLRAHAGELGIDGGRIVLMGHSAGAHLAALVATDPSYFGAASVPMNALSGVVLLDGAAYYVPDSLDLNGPLLRGLRQRAFGSDRERQLRLSPTVHAAHQPNAASFLILYVDRAGAPGQATALARALHSAGTPAGLSEIPDSSHMQLNRDLGKPGDYATGLVDEYVKRVFENGNRAVLQRISD